MSHDVLRRDRGLGLSIVGTNTDPAVIDRWAEIFQAMADTNRLASCWPCTTAPGSMSAILPRRFR